MEAFPVGESGFHGEFRELFPENFPQHFGLDLSEFNPGHFFPPFYPYGRLDALSSTARVRCYYLNLIIDRLNASDSS